MEGENRRTSWRDNFDENDMSVEYVEEHVIDKDMLAQYLLEARGSRRMAELAALCKVSPSAFSRVLKWKVTRPLKQEVVQQIILNAAPSSRVTYYEFMRANGMSPKVEVEARKQRRESMGPGVPEMESPRDVKSRVKNILLEELAARGSAVIPLKRLPREGGFDESQMSKLPVIPKGEYELESPSHFALYMPAVTPIYWSFVIASSSYDKNGPRGVFVYHADFFLRDLWEPETLKDVKTSFVYLDDRENYEKVKTLLAKRKVNNQISLIFISENSDQEPEEWMVPREAGGPMKSIFENPKLSIFGEGSENEDEDED